MSVSKIRASAPVLDLRDVGPRLGTLHMVERFLRHQERPLSLRELRDSLPRRLPIASLRAAVDHYDRLLRYR